MKTICNLTILTGEVGTLLEDFEGSFQTPKSGRARLQDIHDRVSEETWTLLECHSPKSFVRESFLAPQEGVRSPVLAALKRFYNTCLFASYRFQAESITA